MTKVIILGQEPKEEKKLKPIEFVKILTQDCDCFKNAGVSPKFYSNVELISKGYGGNYDIMFAYDNDRNKGCLYLGNFNDGVV